MLSIILLNSSAFSMLTSESNLVIFLFRNHFCSIEEQPDEIVLENIKEELLIEALETLPKHLKQVFVLHIFDGYDKKQIAKTLNLSLNTVQKYVIAATTKLTEYIEEKEWN